MHILKSIVISISMYSKFHATVEWKEEDMKHVLCFFHGLSHCDEGSVSLYFWRLFATVPDQKSVLCGHQHIHPL